MAQLMTLESWAAQRYGADAPCRETLRRWCRDGRIVPRPRRHGRAYYVQADARYYLEEPAAAGKSLVDRMNGR